MPSFDFSSEIDWVHLKNAVDVTKRQVANRYDFKGTCADVLLSDKDKTIVLFGESEFQLNQIKDLLLPAMEKKAPESTKRLKINVPEKMGANKFKQVLDVQSGIDAEWAKKIVKTLKESKLKVQASVQGDSVRVSGAKRDVLQEAILLVKKTCDFPIQAGNFRD